MKTLINWIIDGIKKAIKKWRMPPPRHGVPVEGFGEELPSDNRLYIDGIPVKKNPEFYTLADKMTLIDTVFENFANKPTRRYQAA